MKFDHSTINATLAAVREALRNATGLRACRYARWLLGRTDAQLRAIFNVTQGQIPTLRARLQAKADKATAVEAEAGE